jgi:hypothetical protein
MRSAMFSLASFSVLPVAMSNSGQEACLLYGSEGVLWG